MDSIRFDAFSCALSSPGNRRTLLRLLMTLPVAGGPLSLLDLNEGTAAQGRRKRRNKRRQRHKARRHKHRASCKAGQCADQGNTCVTNSDCPVQAPVCCGTPGTCSALMDRINCGACGKTCLPYQDCFGGECICDVCANGCPFTTIPDALALVRPGATIYVCPGTYVGPITLGLGVSLVGAGDGDDPATNTILDCRSEIGPVVTVTGSTTLGLQGLRIKGGIAQNGAGVTNLDSAVTMTNCTIVGNQAVQRGGGISNMGVLMLNNVHVLQNRAVHAGGVDNHGKLTLANSNVTQNTAAEGGGIINSGEVTLVSSTVTSNNVGNCFGTGAYHGPGCG